MHSVQNDPVEVLDLIVRVDDDCSGETPRDTALRQCDLADDPWARRLVAALPSNHGEFDRADVDRLLIGVHREIDRLSRAARHGPRVRAALVPILDALRDAGHPPPYRVVDQGCGTGYLLRWLAARHLGPDVELVGIDVNPVLVDEATRLAKAKGLDCHFTVGDALEPDDQATVVLSTALLHHLDRHELAAYFDAQSRGSAVAFLHVDLRPRPMTVLGIALVHLVLMRLPVSRHDGIRSAQRAHPIPLLVEVIEEASDFMVTRTGPPRLDPLAPMLTMLVGLRGGR